MLIWRIRDHVLSHNWLAVLVDLVIVVVGIVIGLQVSNWNQDRIENQQGTSYRERMIAELRLNESDNENRRKSLYSMKHSAIAVLAQLNGAPANDPELVGNAWRAGLRLPNQIRRSIHDELVSTGRMQLIGDSSARSEVANYYDAIEIYTPILNEHSPYGDHLREIVPASAADELESYCGEGYLLASDGSMTFHLGRCDVDRLEPSTVKSASSTIRASSEVQADLNRLIADLNRKIGIVFTLDRHSRRLRLKLGDVEAD